MRPDQDTYFLAGAEWASARAECRRRKVGALVVKDGRVVGQGFNGAAPGAPSCLDGACPRGLLGYDEVPAGSDYSGCISNHAERNALWHVPQAQRSGSTVYINHAPCQGCQTLMRSMRVERVVWPDGELAFEGNE